MSRSLHSNRLFTKNVHACKLRTQATSYNTTDLPPPPLGISGLFRLLCSTSYSRSLTFTSADLPLRVVPDFDLRRNHAGAHGANRVTSLCELMTIFFQPCETHFRYSEQVGDTETYLT